MRTCSIDGCPRKVHSRGWCGTHYARWRTTGTTDKRVHVPGACAAPDCDGQVYSNGWCQIHDQRMRRLGRLEIEAPPTLAERLAAGYQVDPSGCWIWTAGRPRNNGYATMSVGDRLQLVHRLSYEHHVGPIPDGLTIDHLCRVRMCINPEHLEPVTRAENTRRELAIRYGRAVAS